MFKTSLIDLFAGLFLSMSILFILSLLLINNPAKNDPEPKLKSEFLVSVSWEKINSDIDLWAFFDNGDAEVVCGYSRRELAPFILQNDHTSSRYGSLKGEKLEKATETLVVNGRHDGVYRFLLHPFSLRGEDEVACDVTVTQLNPLKVIYQDEVVVGRVAAPFLEFTLKKNKLEDVEIDQDLIPDFLPRGF